jgi:hypothetical protein
MEFKSQPVTGGFPRMLADEINISNKSLTSYIFIRGNTIEQQNKFFTLGL